MEIQTSIFFQIQTQIYRVLGVLLDNVNQIFKFESDCFTLGFLRPVVWCIASL